jgi:DNA-binding CsgD family transcriptional regulator
MSIERQVSVGAEGGDHGLTSLEKRLIALVMAGYSPRQSARLIGESEQSVRQRLRAIISRLGVSNRLELVLFALYHGLIAPDEEISAGGATKASVRPRAKPAA